MGPQAVGPIFVSYRRKDTAHVAGRIADRLHAHLPNRRVFLDVDSVGAGVDDDVIRLELVTALENDIPIIPILVDGASMPTRQELPAPMKALAHRNAVRIDYERFDQDVTRLLGAIDGILGERTAKVARDLRTFPPVFPAVRNLPW